MTYSDLKLRLLRSLTSGYSSLDLSRRLGYDFNQVDRWLSGSKQCRWSEFWDLCTVSNADLPETLKAVFSHDPADADEPADFLRHLRSLYRKDSLDDLATKIHCHPSTLKRYMRGDTSCDLDVVFALMDLSEHLLARFFERLLGPSRFLEFTEMQNALRLPHLLAFKPLAGALVASLGLGEYVQKPNHDLQWIADQICVPPQQVQALIVELLAQGAIKWVNDKLVATYDVVQMDGSDPVAAAHFARFWSERAYQRFATTDGKPLTKGPISNIIGFRVAALSVEASKAISEALFRCHQEIINIMDGDDRPKSDVRVVLLHHFSSRDLPSEFVLANGATNLTQAGQFHTANRDT